MNKRRFAAGVMDGSQLVWWSLHSTRIAAERAARKYARQSAGGPNTAIGAGGQSGFICVLDGTILEVR